MPSPRVLLTSWGWLLEHIIADPRYTGMSSKSCNKSLLGRRESSPEKPLPGRKVSALEECVFQNAFHTTQGLDHVCTVVVQVPELPIMPLVCPPERVLLQNLKGKKSKVTILSAYIPGWPRSFLIQGNCSIIPSRYLVLLKVSSNTPALIISQCVPVLLEQGVDSRNATIP